MHTCKLHDIYSRNHKRKRNFQNKIPWLIFKRVYLYLCKFSSRMMTPGLNNGRSNTGVVNMSAPPQGAEGQLFTHFGNSFLFEHRQ